MNNFCKSLAYSIRDELEIDVDDFVSKKKKTCLYVFSETFAGL